MHGETVKSQKQFKVLIKCTKSRFPKLLTIHYNWT